MHFRRDIARCNPCNRGNGGCIHVFQIEEKDLSVEHLQPAYESAETLNYQLTPGDRLRVMGIHHVADFLKRVEFRAARRLSRTICAMAVLCATR